MDAINDWENQAHTHRNRMAPHAYFTGYETADLAATYSRELSRGCTWRRDRRSRNP